MRLVVAVALALGVTAGFAAADTPSPAVAFVRADGAVVVSDADGEAQRVVGSGAMGTVAWSPDGSRLAFTSQIDPSTRHLFVVEADGSALHDLTPNSRGVADHPTWSPDGLRIAFLAGDGSVHQDVAVVDAAGGPPRLLTTDHGNKMGVWWAPTGDLLAFDDDPGAGWGVYTVGVSDGVVRHVAYGAFGQLAADPWSPDGRRLVFTRQDPDASRVVAIDADGSDPRVLTPGFGGAPAWSPDGSTVAYAGTVQYAPDSRSVDVSTVDSAGTGPGSRLTGPLDGAFTSFDLFSRPQYTPGGTQIEFLEGGRSLWRMNTDGTCERRLDAFAGAYPTWRPGSSAGGGIRCVDVRVRLSVGSLLGLRPETADVLVENDGNEPQAGATLSLAAPGANECAPLCPLGTLAPGATRRFHLHFRPESAGQPLIVASVSDGLTPDVQSDNNTAVARPTVLRCSILGDDRANHLVGTTGPDRICGRPGPDRIEGRGGDDLIDAGNGNDVVVAGPGHDTVLARGGRDVIFARDGERDWIDCGTEYDVAVVDRADVVRHCERVLRPAP